MDLLHVLCLVLPILDFFIPGGEAAFDFNTSDFTVVMKSSAFVDKSRFIKAFLKVNQSCVVTAPPKFGKSTLLDMLRRFLEVEVDDGGKPLTKVDYLKNPVRDTPNYRLFVNDMLYIAEKTKTLNRYLGRVPVISVSFKCHQKLKDFDDAVAFLRRAVHLAYRRHSYLSLSPRLSDDQRQYVSSWCDDREFQSFGKQRVSSALRELAEFLRRHFGSRAVVLIDDHDHVARAAMEAVADDDALDDIMRFCVQIINAVLRNNQKNVLAGLVTGVLPLPASSASNSDPEDFRLFEFLGDHPFVKFYGLTEKEVDGLLVYPKLKLGEETVQEAKKRYGGFKTKDGKEIFNMYSLMNFLKAGQLKNFWTMENPLPNIDELITTPLVLKCINRSLKNESIGVDILERLTMKDIVDTRKFIKDPRTNLKSVSKFFNYLLHLGYVIHDYETTPPEDDDDLEDDEVTSDLEDIGSQYGEKAAAAKQVSGKKKRVAVKIPNVEIKSQLVSWLRTKLGEEY